MSHPYTGQKKIKEIIYHIMKPTLEQQGWHLSKIIMNWEILIGNQWKDHIRPSRFAANTKDRSTGTLHLKVSHLGMQHIHFMKGVLIEKLNLFLGYNTVIDIKAQLWHRSLPFTPPKINPDIDMSTLLLTDIEDAKLRQALESLGRKIVTRN